MRAFSPRATFWSVSLGHFTVDMFNGMAPVLLAFLAAHTMPMSNTQIGFAVSLYQITGALSQPLFGLLGDRSGGRRQATAGVAWVVVLLMLALLVAQVTRSYPLMLIPYVLGALGSGAFHPVGAMHAADANRERASTNTSLFFFSGQFGLATGPTLAGFLLDGAATHHNLFTRNLGPAFAGRLLETGSIAPIVSLALIGIPAVLFMAVAIPDRSVHLARRVASAAATAADAASAAPFPVKAVALFAVVVALRSLINPGTVAFLPRMFQLKGWDATAYGVITSAFWLGGGISGVIVGRLADRHDSRYLIAATLLLSAPALWLLTLIDGPLAILLALATGALSGSSHSILVVQAQNLVPSRKGFASGAILGFMFTTGALGSLLIGGISDRIGLINAYHIVAVVTIFTGLLGLALPVDGRRAAQKVAPPPAEALPTGAD